MFIDPQRLEQKPNLSQAKKALLEKHLQGRSAPSPNVTTIRKRATGGFAPLSPAQLRLWYLHQMDPQGSGYNYSTALRLTGSLDIPVLQQCIDEIVRRHQILRTIFAEEDGQPVQMSVPELGSVLKMYDLSLLATSHREAESVRLAKEDGKEPFNLLTGPVLRVTLIRLDENEYVLLFTVHHIAYDGWSAGILLKEFVTLYQAFVKGQASPLAELPIQYADFAEWQHNCLQGQGLGQQVGYWKKQLEGVPVLLELPSDRSRPAIRSYTGATYTFSVSSELTERLRKIGRSSDCTLFTILLSCFNILLYRYSGEQDLCVGIPFAGRMKPELENLIGFFINTLVIRTQLENNPQFIDVVKRTQAVTLDAQANQDVPFDKLVEELKPQRNQGYNPLFQVMFVLHNQSLGAVNLPNLRLETIDVDYEISKFDLVLHATEKEGLELAFEYSTELFESGRIARLASHFQWILDVFSRNLNMRVNDFALLTQQEHDEILTWNATERSFPQNQFLHHSFEKQAQNQPQAIAVSCGQQMLCYQDLDGRANQLAHWLRSQGVRPEVRVGIYLERSIEMAVAVLAILKAGGAYVPINSAYPKEQISSLLADCGASIVLTQERLLAGLLTEGTLFCLDRDWQQLSTLPTDNVSFPQHSSSAAYIIYTSGSTGSPKGVIVTHANAVASTWARSAAYPQPLDSFLLASPLAFDSSVAGLFWTLSLGGRLCIPTEEELQDIEALTDLMAQEKLSHLLCLPSFYSLILDSIGQKRLDNLRTVIVAGEACLPDLAAKHYLRLPEVRLYNEYGPTEATVWSSVYAIQRSDSATGLPLAIGQPIANSQIYLLDSYFNQVPIGVPGELYIGGLGLARGYLGKPDLTAGRFVPNPFSKISGDRLYRTGDLARYRPDGNIEFLGRTDHQVKIRGFRIELGEIEAQILRYPGVSEVLVIAREERDNTNYLAAYWVAISGFEQSPADIMLLKEYLKSRLPDYMIPSAFVQLKRLPRTATGKIDRKSLPLPDWNGQAALHNRPPRTAIEKQLAKIWAELLQIEHIGIDDNFFSLGGDSILAMQMVNRARQDGLHFKPQQLSRHSSIAELAAILPDALPQPATIHPVEGDVPLTPIQHWFFGQHFPNPHHWNQALMLEAQRPVNPHLLKQAIDFLLVYHDALRLRFTQDAVGWHQSYAAEQAYPIFHQVDLSEVDDRVLSSEIEKQASLWQRQLDITEGPLIQVVLFATGENRPARLFMVIHHLAVDGVSWRILLDDLHTAYQQLAANQRLSLPPKSTSYQEWSHHLQELAQSPSMQAESVYWDAVLAGYSALPVDNAQGSNTEAVSVTVTNSLGMANTKNLLAGASGATGSAINEILLAALAKTLNEWSQSPNILIDIDLHGRIELFGDVDLSRSVGWFTSVFPVLIGLPKGSDKKTIRSIVKNQLLQIPNKGIGYGVLRYLYGSQSLAQCRSPVLFNYLGQLDQALPKQAVFRLATESVGPCIDPAAGRYNEFSIDAYILEGALHILWNYSSERYEASTIDQLMANYCQSIIDWMDKN